MELRGKIGFLHLGFLMALSGCGSLEGLESASTSCGQGTAVIGVADGQVARLCGCNEAGGQWVTNNANLVCTVPSGTTVVFQYLAVASSHQIVSAPASVKTFAPSTVFSPKSEPVVRAYAVKLIESGTYAFTDRFDSTLAAQIVVH